ncbi:MAG: Gfo/Idh/MocA family oxidoreductase [Candidatus Omnitrophica bacterium]|nr:Gfo/Idh/MocA family oxidoreductase [Candidatus Omnitrophota bacterium]MDD5552846.1 Gfo/Idh/MocA family oxidoreductase [Candidatus Omnitrophota bacterium]
MIRVAVIGCGYWGKNLVRVFSQLGVLDTICDSDPARLEALRKEYPGVNITASYTQVLKNRQLTAAVVATPAESHYRLTRELLLSGKDVFVEKPLSLTVKDGLELDELAEKRKSILMVGHLLEYHPAINKLKESMESGELGRIQYIYSNRLNLGKIRREENILWSFAPHDISVILLLLNEMPESVSSFGGNYLHRDIADVTLSSLNFSSGVKGHIFVSWLHPYKEQKLIVVGDKKMAVFDDVARDNKLRLYSHQISWIGRVPVPTKEDAENIDFKPEEPLILEAAHFIDCVKSRRKPKTDAKSALRVLSVLQSCQQSLENNGALIWLKAPKSGGQERKKYFIHPSSIVEDPSRLGEGSKVWHFSHVMKGAVIGQGCNIGQNVFIGSKARIGNNVKIQNNISIYDCVQIEDDVFCGPSMVFTNVFNPRSFIERKNEYKATVVKRGATLGANSTIICGNTIGEYAFVGAGAVVTKDIPAYALAYGSPARVKGWVCKCGVKLAFGKKAAKCAGCGMKYKALKESIVPTGK